MLTSVKLKHRGMNGMVRTVMGTEPTKESFQVDMEQGKLPVLWSCVCPCVNVCMYESECVSLWVYVCLCVYACTQVFIATHSPAHTTYTEHMLHTCACIHTLDIVVLLFSILFSLNWKLSLLSEASQLALSILISPSNAGLKGLHVYIQLFTRCSNWPPAEPSPLPVCFLRWVPRAALFTCTYSTV